MAGYRNLKKKEHAFQTMGKDIKAGDIANLLLLCGQEPYLVHWAVGQLVATYVDEGSKSLDFTQIEAEDLTIEKIKESCETLGMLSDKRVVLLSDFPPASGEKLKHFSKEDEQELLDYMQDLPDTCLLIITAKPQDPKNKRKSELQTAVEKVGKVYDFGPLNSGQLQAFAEKRLRADGKACRASVLDFFLESSGYGNKEINYTLYNLENDIKKIIAHSTGSEITTTDVALTVSANPEINIFAMLDAISRNRKEEAYRLLHNLLDSGQVVYSILAMMVSQLELILDVKEMNSGGMTLGQIQKTLGVHEFRIKKALGFKDQYSEEELKRILSDAYEIDGNIKMGLMEPTLALELFLAGI